MVTDFRLGLDLVRRYPVLVAPPFIAMALFVLFVVLVGRTVSMVGIEMGGAMLLNLVASAVVIVMARDALAAREPPMGEALRTVVDQLPCVVIGSLLFLVSVGVVWIVLLLFLPISEWVMAFFLIFPLWVFTLPPVLLEGIGAVDALRRSGRLAKYDQDHAVGFVIGALVGAVAMALASAILGLIPFLGHLLSMLLFGVFTAYLTVVWVRVYQTLPRR